jgi:hypothetical protein
MASPDTAKPAMALDGEPAFYRESSAKKLRNQHKPRHIGAFRPTPAFAFEIAVATASRAWGIAR